MLTSIGLGRPVPSQTDFPSISTPPSVIPKHPKGTSSSSIADDSEQTAELVNVAHRTRHCYSPLRPNSLILSSSQNSSQKIQLTNNEQIIDDDNEKYYSAQSSKLSTPMVHSIGLSSFIRKNSEEKLPLSSILDIDSEEQKTHKIENKNFLR
jgi:hypothetical protein